MHISDKTCFARLRRFVYSSALVYANLLCVVVLQTLPAKQDGIGIKVCSAQILQQLPSPCEHRLQAPAFVTLVHFGIVFLLKTYLLEVKAGSDLTRPIIEI